MEFCSKKKFWNFYDRNAPRMNDHIRPRDLLPYFAGTLPTATQQFVLANVDRLGSSYTIFHFIDVIRNLDRSHVQFFDAIKAQKGLDELVNFITEEFIHKETAGHLLCGSSSYTTNVSSDRIPAQSEITINSSAIIPGPTTSVEQPCNGFLASQPADNVFNSDAEGSRQRLDGETSVADGVLYEEESGAGVGHCQLMASNRGRTNEESSSASFGRLSVQESVEPKCTINHEHVRQAELCLQPESSVRVVEVGLMSECAQQSPNRLACHASPVSTASNRLDSSMSGSSTNDASPSISQSASPQITSASQDVSTSESPQMEQLKEAASLSTDASSDSRESFCALLSTELTGVGEQPQQLSTMPLLARERPLSSQYQESLPFAVQCTAQRGCASMTEANAVSSANVSTVDGPPDRSAQVPEPLMSPTKAEAVSCANVSAVGGPSAHGTHMPDPLAEPAFSRSMCDSGYKSSSVLNDSDRSKDRRSFSPAIALALLSIAVVFCAVAYARRNAALR